MPKSFRAVVASKEGKSIVFESRVEASKYLGCKPTSVTDSINRGRKLFGYIFSYAVEKPKKEKPKKDIKPVVACNGCFMRWFENIWSASKELNISDKAIRRALKSGSVVGGYSWRYASAGEECLNDAEAENAWKERVREYIASGDIISSSELIKERDAILMEKRSQSHQDCVCD